MENKLELGNKNFNVEFNTLNKSQNIKKLRRYLRLTQKEFIDKFIIDEDGNAKISIATLSNIENKGGVMLNEIINDVCDSLGLNTMIFNLDDNQFLDSIENEYELTTMENEDGQQVSIENKHSISNLVNRLTMYFADQILEDKLHRGDQVESDRVLAKKMNVGRSAIREAMKVLQVMGMVDIRPGQGSYISQDKSNFFIIPLSWSFFMNIKQISQMIQVRNALEEKSAELAATYNNEEKLEELGQVLKQLVSASKKDDIKAFLDLDMEFHIKVAESSGNEVILSQLLTIRNLMKRVSKSGVDNKIEMANITEEHTEIYKHIMNKDPDKAREAMRRHMDKSIYRYRFQ